MMGHFAPAPPAAVSRVLASFDRDQLAGFVAVAIDLLDLADGDPECEDDDADVEHDVDREDDDPLEEDDPPGGNVEDDGDGCSAAEDLGTHSYITHKQQRAVKRNGREARKRWRRDHHNRMVRS